MTSCRRINHSIHTEYGTFAETLKLDFDFRPVYGSDLCSDGDGYCVDQPEIYLQASVCERDTVYPDSSVS
jgi:hypothetical protein